MTQKISYKLMQLNNEPWYSLMPSLVSAINMWEITHNQTLVTFVISGKVTYDIYTDVHTHILLDIQTSRMVCQEVR